MESTDEVLVVIQAESGEEIALPLTALDEHQEVVQDPEVRRIKKERKEKLICLPLFDDELEFQTLERPSSITEETKRPRKEYRTKRKLAALNEQQQQQQQQQQQPDHQQQQTIEELVSTPKKQKEDIHQQPELTNKAERRTRPSNACRVATGKMYKCNDCDFSTERINNIIMHMRETCPKIKKEQRPARDLTT